MFIVRAFDPRDRSVQEHQYRSLKSGFEHVFKLRRQGFVAVVHPA